MVKTLSVDRIKSGVVDMAYGLDLANEAVSQPVGFLKRPRFQRCCEQGQGLPLNFGAQSPVRSVLFFLVVAKQAKAVFGHCGSLDWYSTAHPDVGSRSTASLWGAAWTISSPGGQVNLTPWFKWFLKYVFLLNKELLVGFIEGRENPNDHLFLLQRLFL